MFLKKNLPSRIKCWDHRNVQQYHHQQHYPLLYTYGKIIPDPAVLEKSISWLKQIPAEQNHFMDGWKQIGITVKKAAGSQALVELKKQFCDQRKCLECEIGRESVTSAIAR